MYIDQAGYPSTQPTAKEDLPMGVVMAEKYGVRLCSSIFEALCWHEGYRESQTEHTVTIDGVLAIGEHGDYPWNAQEQHMYPRRHFFEQIAGVLSTCPRRSEIPVFTDKFLANSWEDAWFIYTLGKELGLTHMAGSSVPNCFHRDPWLEHAIDTPLEDALMLSYGGLESYGCESTAHLIRCDTCVTLTPHKSARGKWSLGLLSGLVVAANPTISLCMCDVLCSANCDD